MFPIFSFKETNNKILALNNELCKSNPSLNIFVYIYAVLEITVRPAARDG